MRRVRRDESHMRIHGATTVDGGDGRAHHSFRGGPTSTILVNGPMPRCPLTWQAGIYA